MILSVREVHDRLLATHGPQRWWPADTDFQVLAGAVLVQNSRWQNVELALARLAQAAIASPAKVLALPLPELESLLQPAGTFRVKAKRLRAVCEFIDTAGGVDMLRSLPPGPLRARLLAVHGIGPETADALLVYLFHRPVFIVDAYARRLFRHIGRPDAEADYETLRGNIEREFGGSAQEYNELHALIVEHGKRYCRKKPACDGCPLLGGCFTENESG